MSNRTSEANKAIAAAWAKEKQLVFEGKGTRDWTPEQQNNIIEKGKAYDEDGKAYEGHHMKSVSAYPEYQGDAENIQFLSRVEHLSAHGGYTMNLTNGYYDPFTGKTRGFGDNKYELCEVIKLTNPTAIKNGAVQTQNIVEIDKNYENSKLSHNAIDNISNNNTNKNLEKHKTNADNTNKIGNSKSFKPVYKRVLNGIKPIANKCINFFKSDVGHTVLVFLGVAATSVIVGKSGVLNSSNEESESSSNTDYLDYNENSNSDDINEYNYSNVDDVSIDINEQKVKRSPPDEHTVRQHAQRYNEVWKDKAPYPRGGKKTDE